MLLVASLSIRIMDAGIRRSFEVSVDLGRQRKEYLQVSASGTYDTGHLSQARSITHCPAARPLRFEPFKRKKGQNTTAKQARQQRGNVVEWSSESQRKKRFHILLLSGGRKR